MAPQSKVTHRRVSRLATTASTRATIHTSVRRKAAGEECKDIAAALGVCLSVVHKAMKEPKP